MLESVESEFSVTYDVISVGYYSCVLKEHEGMHLRHSCVAVTRVG